MENLYQELLKQAKRLNKDINKLRAMGEYMASCHLQDGYMATLEALGNVGMLSEAGRSELETELMISDADRKTTRRK